MTTPILEKSTIRPSQSSHGKTWAYLTIGVLVFEGLYWLGIASLQLLLVITGYADRTLTLTALWNIAMSFINLWFIRDIVRRRESVGRLFGVAVVGVLWGGYSAANGALCQIPAVVMYILLAVLVYVNREYYTEAGEKWAKARPADLPRPAPTLTSEGAGIKRGLTAVEAAMLLERPVDTVLTMILFGVLKKGAARILSANPLRLEVAQTLPDGLYDYEVDFLKAIRGDQAHWADSLKWSMVRLGMAVASKVRDFSRAETVKYYRGVVEKAWQDMQAAATPEVKSQKFDEVMDWALLDSNFPGRCAETLGPGRLPVPRWWERFTPLLRPARALPILPGAGFAASMADAIQNFSAAAIGDIHHFTSEIASQTGLWITE